MLVFSSGAGVDGAKGALTALFWVVAALLVTALLLFAAFLALPAFLAGAFLALVQDRHAALAIVLEQDPRGYFDQRRHVENVAQVRRVSTCVEASPSSQRALLALCGGANDSVIAAIGGGAEWGIRAALRANRRTRCGLG